MVGGVGDHIASFSVKLNRSNSHYSFHHWKMFVDGSSVASGNEVPFFVTLLQDGSNG